MQDAARMGLVTRRRQVCGPEDPAGLDAGTSAGLDAGADVDEGTLIERSQRGDLDAFDRLVLIHQDRIYHLAYRVTGNAEDARDVAQETFIKAYRALPRYRHHAAFGTWLHRIAVNTALDLVRRRPQAPPAGLEEVKLAAAAHNPDLELERREAERRVQAALARLSPPHRTIVVLRDLQGMAYEEIAGVLGIPIGTVRSRLSRAREALRQALRDLGVVEDAP
jgi:RNA polymerase sigma-70 factor (ECF subfamily)